MQVSHWGAGQGSHACIRQPPCRPGVVNCVVPTAQKIRGITKNKAWVLNTLKFPAGSGAGMALAVALLGAQFFPQKSPRAKDRRFKG